MTLEGEPILRVACDAPFLRRDLGVLAHALACRAIGDRRDVEANIARLEVGEMRNLLPERSRLLEAANPVGEALSEAELDPAHALDAADEREIAVDAVDHT